MMLSENVNLTRTPTACWVHAWFWEHGLCLPDSLSSSVYQKLSPSITFQTNLESMAGKQTCLFIHCLVCIFHSQTALLLPRRFKKPLLRMALLCERADLSRCHAHGGGRQSSIEMYSHQNSKMVSH